MTAARWRRFGRVLRPATPHLIRSTCWPAIPVSWVAAACSSGARSSTRPRRHRGLDARRRRDLVRRRRPGRGHGGLEPDRRIRPPGSAARADRSRHRARRGSPAPGRFEPGGLSLPDGDAWLLLATFTMFALAAELWPAAFDRCRPRRGARLARRPGHRAAVADAARRLSGRRPPMAVGRPPFACCRHGELGGPRPRPTRSTSGRAGRRSMTSSTREVVGGGPPL